METQEVFKAIVNALGDEWEYIPPTDESPNYPGCTVKNEEKGWSFTLHYDTYRKKVEIWGDFPRTPHVKMGKSAYGDAFWSGGEAVLHGDEYPKRIYVSPDRPAEAIAKDIKRRFIPTYEAAFNLAMARIAEQAVSADKTAANMEELKAALGDKAKADYYNRNNRLHWSNGASSSPYLYADFDVSDTTVSVKLSSVPLSVALEIAKVLTGRG